MEGDNSSVTEEIKRLNTEVRDVSEDEPLKLRESIHYIIRNIKARLIENKDRINAFYKKSDSRITKSVYKCYDQLELLEKYKEYYNGMMEYLNEILENYEKQNADIDANKVTIFIQKIKDMIIKDEEYCTMFDKVKTVENGDFMKFTFETSQDFFDFMHGAIAKNEELIYGFKSYDYSFDENLVNNIDLLVTKSIHHFVECYSHFFIENLNYIAAVLNDEKAERNVKEPCVLEDKHVFI